MPLTAASELLTTKLARPRPGSSVVPRDQLFMRLDKGLEQKLTLIAAPAGYGKTTLLGEWAATRNEPIAWVSLDEGDNDPGRFWRYVITACRSFDPALGKAALSALRASQQPLLEPVLTSFVNELARLPNRRLLVLDDYHVITSREIHETVTFLLDHIPASLHMILIARNEPPLPLARLRARNEMNEIAAADLRFSPKEIELLFQATLNVKLSAEAVARLEARTEGWAAGLRLMTLALEGKPGQSDPEKLLATFTGTDRHILDYLVGDVLAGQPESHQVFLLKTSFMNRLTASLCDAVTGQSDSGQLLEQLARANLFVIPLGSEGERQWYRYHTLFAEAMHHHARQRFGEVELRSSYDKAALWYEAHGFLAEAVETSIAAHAFERAAALIERFQEQRGSGELYTLRRWIEQLPREVLDAHPTLCFTDAMALLFSSDRYATETAARVEVPLRAAERAWRNERNDAKLGQVLALRAILLSWQGELTRAFALAHEALRLLPEDDTNWRGSSLLGLGLEELLAGNIDSAQNRFIEARALCGAAQNIHGVLAAMSLLGEASFRQGEFDQASQLYQQVLADAVGGEEMLDDQAAAHLGLGAIAFERNELERAERDAARALELGRQRSDEQMHVEASLLLARVEQARGKAAPAQERIHALVARTRQPRLLRQVLARQARFALAAGDLAAVQRWYAALVPGDDAPRTQQEQEALIVARMHITNGKPEAALELLERWRADAHKHGRTRSELEILCLKAMTFSAQADTARASKTLHRALALAQPKGYQRVFLDEGEKIALLLQAVLPDIEKRAVATYATLLLRAFASTRSAQPASTLPTVSPLLEPLSPQEHRVLRLLAAGLSNPEIARELVVSTNTIKTQLQSIYRKLNVNNRDEARDLARQLNLL